MRHIISICALLVALLMTLGACDKKSDTTTQKEGKKVATVDEEEEHEPGTPREDGTWKNDLQEDLDMECHDKVVIDSSDPKTPEGVIHAVYAAALKGRMDAAADAAHFASFYSHFAAKHAKDWVKKQYWPRIKEHIPKYTKSDKDPSYLMCKKIEKKDGSVKIFVKSWFEKKSNPPIILVPKKGGGWVIDVFSY